MSAASIAVSGNANPATEQMCGAAKGSVRPTQAVMQKLQNIYPKKTAETPLVR